MGRIIVTAVAIMTSACAMAPMAMAGDIGQYTDYNSASWSAPAVKFVVDNDIMQGTDNHTLSLKRNITRAEFVSLMDRLFATYRTASVFQFEDVSQTEWFHDNVSMGIQMGIIQGTSENTFSPNGNLTREMAITILARALALESDEISLLNEYSDGQAVSEWAKSSVAVMMAQQRLNGYTDGTLRPQQYITREETAQLLKQCFSSILEGTTVNNVQEQGICLIRSGKDTTIQDGTFTDTLVLANGMADTNVYIKDSSIKRLLCWGSHDVWIYPDNTVEEIVISRTDGPCVIHWLGDNKKIPSVKIRGDAAAGSKVVNKDGKQLYPTGTEDLSTAAGGGSSSNRNVVYLDPCNGETKTTVSIGENGYIKDITDPARQGYVFGGWYFDSKYEKRTVLSNKISTGITLYAKWYTPEEWEVVKDLNQGVSDSTASIKAETDLLAVVGETTVPCNIQNDNGCNIKVELIMQDTDMVIGAIDNLKAGQTAAEIPLVTAMPTYGNYPVYLRITPEGSSSGYDIVAMLYVAYAWQR